MRRLFDRLATTGDRMTAWGLRLLAGRGVRKAWLVVASVSAVFMLLTGTIQVTSLIAHEEVIEVSEIAVVGVTGLDIDNDAGATRVVGVDDAETITVRARISNGLRKPHNEISRDGGTLVVEASCPMIGSQWCEVDYTVEVPSDMDVDADARGRLTVTDLAGRLRLDADQGSVDLARVGGDITVSASQGSVDAVDLTATRVNAEANQGSVDLAFATSPDEIVTESNQGSITIVLPDEDGVVYATQTEANQGSATSDIREDPAAGRTIVAESNQGSITITYAP
ncbi:MAG TPA: hypothetical protein VFZ30_07870 [Acidimicrobiales bacterium]